MILHVTCLWSSQILSTPVLLVAGMWYFRSIEFLLIAVNGSIAFAKLGNAIHLLIQRPYLFPRFALFRKALVPSLALNAARFSVTSILAAAVENVAAATDRCSCDPEEDSLILAAEMEGESWEIVAVRAAVAIAA